MNQETKVFIGIGVITVAILIGAVFLFDNQESISPELFPKLADELRLDLEQFKKDMESQEIKDKVEADLNDARTLGVNSTPTFYLNGTKVNLANFDDLKTQVEKSLR